MDDLKQRKDIQALANQVRNLAQVSIITEIDFANVKARVEFDTDFVSDWLPWTETLAGNTHTWTPPQVGDQAIVLAHSTYTQRAIWLLV
ncbi:phage baseplate assembly protein V [Abyssogena phaseoliformis symbiont]|uniref:phage baseplate assembly protein V n=1 Tax=Abyssogena phaseoliformis symbiont TaxID=596095 RepID=UPI0019164AEC|nr:phage baseplate assembly protein V [Abyssogena phaseoliformis symbiont]